MRRFQLGEAVEVYGEVRDQAGNLTYSAGGVNITITDPKGTVKIGPVAMTPVTAGVYSYFYESQVTDEPGWYKVKGEVIDGTKLTITIGGFELE